MAFLFKYTSPGNQGWWAIDKVAITAGESAVAAPPPPIGIPIHRGDCNSNASFNIADCLFLLASLFSGGASGDRPDCFDMNDDGSKNIADAITGLGTHFCGGSPLPDPGSNDCGVDPTADGLICDPTAACH